MKFFTFLIILIMIAAGLYFSGILKPGSLMKTSNVTQTQDGISVDLTDLTVTFSSGGEFTGEYMMFGGRYIKHKNAVVPVAISGLPIDEAKNIYAQYPDFHRCSSPGADLAKPQVVGLDIVPLDSSVTDELKKAIKLFNDNIRNNGDRVCISVRGQNLDLQQALIKQNSADVTDKYGNLNFMLIDGADIMDCKRYLAASE